MSLSDAMKPRQGLIQRVLFRVGITLLIIAAGLGFSDLIGIFEMPEFILFGESALKTYARIAVIGCAAAAIGSWESISPQHTPSSKPMRPKSKE